MRHHDPHAAALRLKGLNHMEDKGVIPLGLGRQSALEATELIVPRFLITPFIQRKGRVGGHDIEAHQVAVFIQ